MTVQDLQHPGAAGVQILYQDGAVIVIDKPAGVAVSRGRAGGPSVDDFLEGLRQGKRHLPQPAHRLDAETSGCLALGRTKPAMAALGALFAGRAVEKVYWAVVVGGPCEDAGVIDSPLLKISSQAAGWRMVVDDSGQPALTRWRVLGRGEGLAWLELTPETGRTHQLRVHCASQGWLILGDAMYGSASPVGRHGSSVKVAKRSATGQVVIGSTTSPVVIGGSAAPVVIGSAPPLVIGSAPARTGKRGVGLPGATARLATQSSIQAATAPGNLHLLARRLAFTLETRVDVEAPVPPAMQPALRLCGW
ncbi:MAG: pseudouridine synthase [Rhodospirillales bacterium]|nr:pseudouridine synthase [Rhodospirillales bacterium]